MRSFLEAAKLVVFDLDGTLYEDTDHFDYYAELLKQEVTPNEQASYQQDYEEMKAGKHIVQIGKAYDVENDYVLTLDPMTLKITEVYKWDGQQISQDEIDRLYQKPLQFNFEDMIAIGDGWWLPFVAAKHYGVKDTYTSYNKTKEYMVTENFELTKTPGLKNGLVELKESKKLVLCTNSDIDDVGRLLKELELDTIFEHILPSSMKPTNTESHFKKLLEQYECQPHEVVSIGDNFINEIAPALKLGMRAVYIHPTHESEDQEQLMVVPTLANVWS
ncbi:putative hydrolase of the HAD superfamily [Bacillus mesophilus]|uniref:HAD family hydrolase n=1 Tax=Bacillus mesophilus TaxID=1808955 RepID=A0A6M0Q9P8_9BACI|nr:HAD family hydrolase [Bacillus mesophilus]MBM7662396.1 putative hydrolase of the HAD superfamily [Bacillus mesophilus]NEY72977.1 HAD family hydrolase [Bacillus mesophilus]